MEGEEKGQIVKKDDFVKKSEWKVMKDGRYVDRDGCEKKVSRRL